MTRREPIGQGKISQHGGGVGTVTRETVQKRARELAISDGRSASEVTSSDWEQAKRELIGAAASGKMQDDLDEATSSTEWDPAPGTVGQRADTQEVDDEQTFAEQLTQEGVEEADHDERVESGRETRRRGQE